MPNAFDASKTALRVMLARQAAGLSIEEMARQAGVRPQVIEALEGGQPAPRPGILAKLAACAGLHPFYLERKIAPVSLGAVSPALSLLAEEERSRLIARVQFWLERYLDLESHLPGPLQLPPMPRGLPRRIETREDAIAAAQALREGWHLGASAPIAHFCEMLEAHGMRLSALPPQPMFDAAGLFTVDNLALPLIVYNQTLDPQRQRYALCRELGFFFFKPPVTDPMLVVYFIAAFLVPEEAARATFKDLKEKPSLKLIMQFDEPFGLPTDLLINWLADLSLLSKQEAQRLSVEYKAIGSPLLSLPPERPARLNNLAAQLEAQGSLTRQQAAVLAGDAPQPRRLFAAT